MIRNFLLALGLGLFSTAAAACEDYVQLDRAQTTDLLNELRSPETEPLFQLFAFETLMCSDQSGVRDLTLRTGAKLNNPTVQSQVLARALMEMENIPIRLLEVEGLSKEQFERIKQRPVENMPVTFRDTSKSCIAFSNKSACDTNGGLSINGTRATLRTRFNGHGLDGDFLLKDGKLSGILTFTREGQTYPALIDLF